MQMIAIIGPWELILNNFRINRDRNPMKKWQPM